MIRIKEIRKQKKITAKELADKVNVAESTMSLYENGKREPDIATLLNIAKHLNVSVDYLLGANSTPLNSNNRLRIYRVAKNLSQKEMADLIEISESDYMLLECGQANIDYEKIQNIADKIAINVNFLLGRPYKVTCPPHLWRVDNYEDYKNSTPELRTYLEYLHGKIVYIDSEDSESTIFNNHDEKNNFLTNQEQQLLHMFRSTTEEGRMRIVSAVVNICDQMEEKRIAPSIEKNA